MHVCLRNTHVLDETPSSAVPAPTPFAGTPPHLLYVFPHLPFSPHLLQQGGGGVLLPLKGHQGHQFTPQSDLGSTSPSPPGNTAFPLHLLPTSLAASFPPLWDLLPLPNLGMLGPQRDLRTEALTCSSSTPSLPKCLSLALMSALLIPNCFSPALNSRLIMNCLLTSPLECPANTADFTRAKEPLGIGIPSSLHPITSCRGLNKGLSKTSVS